MPKSSSDQPGCLLAIFKLFNISPATGKEDDESLPYRLRDDFLSAAELSFYRVLSVAFAGKAVICPKVRVGDILFVAQPNRSMSFSNRINQKHVDFVLCDPISMKPLGVLELDDSSHGQSSRKARDEFLDQAFEAAGLPVVHVGAQRTYNVAELQELLSPILNRQPGKPVPRKPATAVGAEPIPSCPKCDVSMVLRTAKKGDRAGEQFWGCANYPKCKEVVAAGNSD